jgi:pimeloyl-ACP methyl ester carboxylesterase
MQRIAGVDVEIAEPTGTPVTTAVMMHGIGLGPWFFEPWFKILTDKGIRCIALRMPGHSPEDPDTRLQEMAEAGEKVIRSISGPVVLVGHSASGLVAQMLASRLTVQAIALIAPLPPGQIFMLPNRSVLRQSIKMLPNMLRGRPLYVTEAAYQKIGMNAIPPEQSHHWYQKVMPWPKGLLKDVLLRPKIDPSTITAPVLVMIGAEDRLVPWDKARVIGDLYEAVVWRYDGLAHMPPLEKGGERMGKDLAEWLSTPTAPQVLESEGYGPREGVGHQIRRQRRGVEMKRRSAYGQKGSARKPNAV